MSLADLAPVPVSSGLRGTPMWTLQQKGGCQPPGGGTQRKAWLSQEALGGLAVPSSRPLSKAPNSKQERVKFSVSHWRRKW